MSSVRLVSVYLMLISGVSPLHSLLNGVEHFPWGLVCLILFGRAPLGAVFISFYVCFYFLITFFYLPDVNVSSYLAILLMCFNLISPIFFFRGNENLLARAARNVFWLYFTVGVLQFFSILVPAEIFLDFLISRFHGGPVGSGYRGVQMLETEPARASYQFLALYLVSQILGKGDKTFMTIALVLGQVVLISSTTGLVLTGLYLIWKVVFEISRKGYLLLFLAAAFFILLPAIQNNPKTAIAIDSYQSDGLSGAFSALAATSGGRFLGSVNAISLIIGRPFGSGADPEVFQGEKAVQEDQPVPGYVLRSSPRPVSGALTALVIFGIPFVLVLSLSVRSVVGPFRMSAPLVFAIVLSVVYSPPFGEMSLLIILAASYAQALSRLNSSTPRVKTNGRHMTGAASTQAEDNRPD